MSIAMDHQWRIYINPNYVTSCSVEKTAAVLIHELNHALRGPRRTGQTNRRSRAIRLLEDRL